MELNQKVADFTLQTDEDKTVSLSSYAGQPVILFFYPRADTPGCTIEAWASAATRPGIKPNSAPSTSCPTRFLLM
jgi:peroxiredoxin